MKRNGYTIAEALITMAIIGIVASLTLPTFISRYRKQVYASTLSSSVSNFENAMTTMMMKEGVDDLLDTKAWNSIKSGNLYNLNNTSNAATIKTFMGNIAPNLPIESYKTATAYYKRLNAPNSNASVSYGAPVRFKTRSGVEYMIYVVNATKAAARQETTMLSAGGNYMNRAADVYIDINGDNPPNVFGRDHFRYELGTDGRLYPFGGKDWAIFTGQTYVSPRTNCAVNKDGYYCGAYLMENGYKMDY